MTSGSRRRAALLRSAALVLGIGAAAFPGLSVAQSPRITPPPPCVVPAEFQVRPATRARTDRRPYLVVESFDVISAELRDMHLPWALTEHLRERLARAPGIAVANSGTTERALAEARGNPDSAAALLGADWIVRGSSRALPLSTELTVVLLRRGNPTPVLRAVYRLTTASLSAVEESIAKGVVSTLVGADAPIPPPRAGSPKRHQSRDQLALADYLLRSVRVAEADSARRVLERAFAADTTSPLLAVRLAESYLQVVERGGVAPPVRRADALRRADELAAFALANDAKRSDAWTVRAVVARLRDTLDLTGARDAHTRALALNPNDAAAIHELAMTYVAMGDDTRGAAELRRALRAEPERPSSLSAIAAIELRARRFNQACAFANAAIAAWMFDPAAYAVRAQARVRLGQTRDAYADSETAARLSQEPWTQGLRLIIEMDAGNREGALSLAQTLAQRYLAPGRLLSVYDAAMLAKGFLSVDDTRRARDAIGRATPRGRELATWLRDGAFAPLQGDSLYRALSRVVAPATRGR